MDFISLATEQHRFVRFLDEMLGSDDVNDSNNNNNALSIASSQSLQYDTMSGSNLPNNNFNQPPPPELDTTTVLHRPIFSKNAEGELFQLATNFLLYVALVIVVILVCRIYFPELLIARSSNSNYDNHSKSSSYRVADPQRQSNNNDDDDEIYYGTDAEDDDDDDEDNEHNEQDVLFNKKERTSTKKPQQNFSLEFQQESLSRKQVLQRLIFCCIMLNVTFVLWGALQVSCFIFLDLML